MSAPPPPAAAQPDAAAPTELTKSGAKKEAKRLEKAAKLATKVKNEAVSVVGAAVTGEKKKPQKEKEPVAEEAPFVNTTPKGEKKDMTAPMSAGYNPTAVEAAWYDWWKTQGYFTPKVTPGETNPKGIFVLPSPPPNVTGSLHIGHGLTVAIQDTLVRWNRMLGKSVLFAPGFDHAGISTQSVVEKRLFRIEGKTRHDYTREDFVNKVWDWKHDYQQRITDQLCRLGGSYDWTRTAFTMDENVSAAVAETFCRLHEDGIIYRANRLVNWCTKLSTTLSNLEVDQKKLEGRTLLQVPGYDLKEKFEFGVITSFAYPLEGSDEKIIVATTRPETMLGDTAIAVHPNDPRYKHLHGKYAMHPFVDRRIPIVTDDIAVDMEFGTGAVKITPAHDPNDYEVGMRHKLEFINILNDDGTFNDSAGPMFKGMKRFHARNAVVEKLKERGLYIETKDNPMNVPICSKSGDIIEPVMKPQWWVKCQPLAEAALKRTRAGELVITPKLSEGDWYRWLENIQDWCISRQLWWGLRCPAYQIILEADQTPLSEDQRWVVGRTLEEATQKAEAIVGGRKFTLLQDEDVLDTWFSAGLWPFATLGWPKQTQDLATFYPATLLETGWDILFFWVARMVLLGVHLTGQMPFKEVLCHAMIRDAHGRKMSKSLGNVIDPLDVMEGISLEDLHKKLELGNLDAGEIGKAKAGQKKDFPKGIPQCGTDALRFALCAYSGGGRDINLEILRVEGYRKFCNKLWNATKFAMLKFDEGFVPRESSKPTGRETLAEQWILNKLNIAAIDINQHLADRNFMLATSSAHNFWLYELCDVFIEATKPMTDPSVSPEVRRSAQDTLYTCLDAGLKLLHPFMPFVTEELWQRLPRRPSDTTPSIMLSSFPEADTGFANPEADKQFETVFATIKAIRSLSAQYHIQSNLQATLLSSTPAETTMLESQAPAIVALTKGCNAVSVVSELDKVPQGCGSIVISPSLTIFLLVKGMVDIDGEITKCEKKLDLANLSADKIRKLLTSNIPETVRESNQEKLLVLEAEIENLRQSKEMFQQLK